MNCIIFTSKTPQILTIQFVYNKIHNLVFEKQVTSYDI